MIVGGVGLTTVDPAEETETKFSVKQYFDQHLDNTGS